MKLFKKILSFATVLTVISSCAVLAPAAAAVETKDVTMTHYTEEQGFHKKNAKYTYSYKLSNNDNKNITVDFHDDGDVYFLGIRANKSTTDKKPVLTVYYKKDGEKITVSKTRYTVKKAEQLPFKDVKINTGMTKDITLKNPYFNLYKFKTDKDGIVKISTQCYVDTKQNETHSFKALKAGTVKVSAYVKGTSKKAGSFKVKVGSFPAYVKDEFSPLKLKYSPYGASAFLEAGHVDVKDILEDTKKGAKYTAAVDDEDVASTIDSKTIYSVSNGSTTATIYEKLDGKKKAILTLPIKVTTCKMSYVSAQNREFYNDGIFGNGDFVEYLDVSEKLNMRKTIKSCLINNDLTGSHFPKSAYTITYKSSNTKICTVDSVGVVTAKKYGNCHVKYTITFSDKSTHTGECQISVTNDEI